jgi:hypothetical protein
MSCDKEHCQRLGEGVEYMVQEVCWVTEWKEKKGEAKSSSGTGVCVLCHSYDSLLVTQVICPFCLFSRDSYSNWAAVP